MLRIGPYQVVRELARGGMGAVYLAQEPQGQQVAIKVILASGIADPEQARRFSREAQALEVLDHPGILKVRSHGVDRGRGYMVMDLLAGQDLAAVVKEQGALPSARVVAYGQRMASALAHSHARGILHRDLKPANAILGPDGPVLVDFGLARLTGYDVSVLTRTGQILGTPAYMSPEQADGSREIGPATDVYGLGATLYCLATGRAPFSGSSTMGVLRKVLLEDPPPPRELAPDVDPDLEAVILRCLAKEPEDRFASADELAQALARLGPAGRTSRGSQRRAAQAPASSSRKLLVPLLAAIAALGIGLWVVLRGEVTPPPSATDPRPVAAGHASSAEATRLVERGRALGTQGDYEGALSAFSQALELDPDSGAAWAGKAQALIALGDEVAARDALGRGISADPDYPKGYTVRGRLHVLEERWTLAVEDFTRALALDPDDADAHLNRAIAYHRLGLLEGALADFDAAARVAPGDVDLWTNRAQLLRELGRDAEALADFDRALALSPEAPVVFDLRGQCKAALGRGEEALADFDRAIELAPTHPISWANRADMRAELGDLEGAVADFDRALALDPGLARAHFKRGRACHELRRHVEAIASLTETLRLDPTLVTAHYYRGLARAATGDLQGAVADYDRCLEFELDPQQAEEVRLQRGSALELLEQASRRPPGAAAEYEEQLKEAIPLVEREPQRALVLVDAVLAREQEIPTAHLVRGMALHSLGRSAEALLAFDRAEAIGGPDAVLFHSRAVTKQTLGRLDEALVDAELAVGRDPSRPEFVITCVELLQLLGRRDAAIGYLDRLGGRRLPPGLAAWVERKRRELERLR